MKKVTVKFSDAEISRLDELKIDVDRLVRVYIHRCNKLVDEAKKLSSLEPTLNYDIILENLILSSDYLKDEDIRIFNNEQKFHDGTNKNKGTKGMLNFHDQKAG